MRARSAVVSLALAALAGAGCTFGRIVWFNIPDLGAARYFDARAATPAPSAKPLPRARANRHYASHSGKRASFGSFEAMLDETKTHAFVAIRHGVIEYERYGFGSDAETVFPGFSMSKTWAALAVGCAMEDGLLPGPDARLVDVVAELGSRPRYDEVTFDQLLRMTAGIDFDEESVAGAALYYTTDLRDYVDRYAVRWKPGSRYAYGSISIALLEEALDRRLAGESFTRYFERRIWRPLGATAAATWSLDSEENGVEKLFGGFNATATDHARIGLLYLGGGVIEGRRVVDGAWVARSLEPDPIAGTVSTSDGRVLRARYQWFMTTDRRAYFAKGYRGQYVLVVPDRDVVFVRFGEKIGEVDWPASMIALADEVEAR
jgi:CubicO group peptidase (beta-lactamase class C family)